MPRLSWNRTGAVSPPTRRVHFGLRRSSASRPPAGAASQMDTQHGGAGGGRSLSQVYCGASLLVARLATSPFHRRERLGDGRHCPAGRSNAKDQRLEQRCVSATATCGHAGDNPGAKQQFPRAAGERASPPSRRRVTDCQAAPEPTRPADPAIRGQACATRLCVSTWSLHGPAVLPGQHTSPPCSASAGGSEGGPELRARAVVAVALLLVPLLRPFSPSPASRPGCHMVMPDVL